VIASKEAKLIVKHIKSHNNTTKILLMELQYAFILH